LATVCVALTLISAVAVAEQPFCVGSGPSEPVDAFLALDAGKLEAQIVVRDAFHARLMLTNPKLVPITVKLPDVMAARPVLAQFGNGTAFGMQGSRGGAAPQTVGATTSVGPFGQQQGQGNNGNNGNNIFNNGIFNIPPEQVRTVELRCLCLEHGKPNPRAAVKYELVPLAKVSGDARLAEVLRSYGHGEADRDTAQAAAWHIAGGLAWEKLAGLSQMIALNAEEPWFSSSQLRQAQALVAKAGERAAAAKKNTTTAVVEGKRLNVTSDVAARRGLDLRTFSTKNAAAVDRQQHP
jgi:hypothetical protein